MIIIAKSDPSAIITADQLIVYIRIAPADMKYFHLFIVLIEPIDRVTQLRQIRVIHFPFFIDLLDC